ncbi:hypothetical protein SGL43_04617 [Streptomyces globisporus]|uniref:Uncharacterized protein n=1 Tax=Streptomyces globisporus TaxID=1908 RepID=A0ABN8V4P4_STRGL|nr:hypothetical protein SGL43_04617 [Streptomyces globisporus]
MNASCLDVAPGGHREFSVRHRELGCASAGTAVGALVAADLIT